MCVKSCPFTQKILLYPFCKDNSWDDNNYITHQPTGCSFGLLWSKLIEGYISSKQWVAAVANECLLKSSLGQKRSAVDASRRSFLDVRLALILYVCMYVSKYSAKALLSSIWEVNIESHQSKISFLYIVCQNTLKGPIIIIIVDLLKVLQQLLSLSLTLEFGWKSWQNFFCNKSLW